MCGGERTHDGSARHPDRPIRAKIGILPRRPGAAARPAARAGWIGAAWLLGIGPGGVAAADPLATAGESLGRHVTNTCPAGLRTVLEKRFRRVLTSSDALREIDQRYLSSLMPGVA